LDWVRSNHLPTGGIRVESGHPGAYPEVTGYLVPTLIDYGERELAAELVRWLVRIQNADGSFPDPDQGRSYVFDTGQALRGLLAGIPLVPEAREAAGRAAEYLRREMIDGGARGYPQRYSGAYWVETAQLYVLPPLVEAADRLGEPSYGEAAERCRRFYAEHADFLRVDNLTHFLAYELEALIDLGCAEPARPVLDRLRKAQKPDGSVRGAGGSRWVCVPGLAQLAVCWYKLGWWEPADKAVAWVESRQRPSGGFRGSSGLGAKYKPNVEVSWAPKFYLDAHRLRIGAFFDRQEDSLPTGVSPQDGRAQLILDRIRPGDRVVEVGCGMGRFLKVVRAVRPEAVCTGVDPSPRLTSHLPPEVDRVLGRLESIPLPANTFDVVFSVEAIEHCPNPSRAVAELIRVARPGGWIVVIDKQRAHWGRLECPPWEHWPDVDQLRALLDLGCGEVTADPVAYDDKPASDGLMIAWCGRKRSG
jgi:malonyl-CoA O-methyltransferase